MNFITRKRVAISIHIFYEPHDDITVTKQQEIQNSKLLDKKLYCTFGTRAVSLLKICRASIGHSCILKPYLYSRSKDIPLLLGLTFVVTRSFLNILYSREDLMQNDIVESIRVCCYYEVSSERFISDKINIELRKSICYGFIIRVHKQFFAGFHLICERYLNYFR